MLTKGANGTTTLSLIAQQTFAENRIYGLGAAYSILTFITVMIVVVHLHPDRGRQHPRPGGGLGHGDRNQPRERAEHPRPRPRKKAPKPQGGTPWWMWIAVAAIVVFCLFPFYWLVNLSLKTGADLGDSSLFPPNPTLDNYKSIFNNADFTRALLNSAIISLDDHGARARRRLLLRLRARASALRGQVRDPRAGAVDHDVPGDRDRGAAVPAVDRTSGIFNTLIGLIIPNLTFALPLAIYILVSFFKEIPKDLEEAALVDGATHFRRSARSSCRSRRRVSPRRAS